MRVPATSRRWPLSFSIPTFGLFSFCVAFFFSFAFLNFLSPQDWKDLSPTKAGELSGPQIVSFLSLSAGMAAAGSGMLLWGLLIVLPWKWLQTKAQGMTVLFGSLIGLIEILCTSCIMWVIYVLLILFILPPSSDTANTLLALLPSGSLGLGIFTLVIVSFASKGIVFLVGIGTSLFFALLARRIFS
ncbi:MAG: hypothetical protein E6J34_06450 [Chloroflexi bacterium]|nr:MAG: hypothetical protein E6J34_06450 [Chloroflexota bacterium]